MNQRTPLPMDEPHPPETPAAGTPPPQEPLPEPLTVEQIEQLKERIVQVLHTCFDPEIPVNIYELGLIYDITIAPTGAVGLRMTLTSPACPVAGTLPGDVQRKIQGIDQVRSVQVDVVWDPPWHKDLMSEAAKLQLGLED
jgi:FeS assembly SUF system protein